MQQPLPETPAANKTPSPSVMRVLSALMRRWIRIRHEPQEPITLFDDMTIPTVYVIERYGLSDTLILEQAVTEACLPSTYTAAEQLVLKRKRAVAAVTHRRGILFNRNRHVSRSETLEHVLAFVRANPERDVRLLPASIFVGRAPEREAGWFRVLFSENWGAIGRFRRFFAVLLNGRDTIVQFSAPISVRQLIAEEGDASPERTLRKLSRVLRIHFRRIRTAVIGPDLSHRRTVVDSVVNAESVRNAISTVANKENISSDQARARAREYAWEIAADYSHPVVRSLSFLLTAFWNKLYDGVSLNHFDKLRAIVPGHEVIYVPCHRSHIDYLLLSYLLHRNGLSIPHVAAGINLNLPIVGPLLRRGGAFFLRRSFKANALYSAVFSEYVSQLFARGVALEYFIEGGRSRTGRLLMPRGGMLAMTVRSFLRESQRPVVFQPVYIGYEKLMEGNAYIGELSGDPKQKESLLGLMRSFGVLRQHYGKVVVNMGEPIFLNSLLEELAPEWHSTTHAEEKPAWMGHAVDVLAERIQININRAADVNPINLLALVLLSTPKHAMSESDLIAQLELNKEWLTELPYSDRITITAMSASEIIAYGEKMQWIQRIKHPLGDILICAGKSAVLLSYFRNNVLHLFAAASWVACCFLNNRRMSKTSVLRLGKLIYPFIQAELFLPWDEEEFVLRIQATIDFFLQRGLLETDTEGRILRRGPGQSDANFHLRAIAHSLSQAFERYYIAIAVLVKNGPHTQSTNELENLCYLTAQRLSLLQELNAPEFFDKNLFKGFIQKLRERRVVWTDDAGKLDFDKALEEVARGAKVILSRETRHGILKLTHSNQ